MSSRSRPTSRETSGCVRAGDRLAGARGSGARPGDDRLRARLGGRAALPDRVLRSRRARASTTISCKARCSSSSWVSCSRWPSPRAWSRTSPERCRVIPKAEEAHWLAAAIALLIGLLLVSELIVGPEVFRKRAWRAYLFPAVVIVSSVLLWVITIFSTFSTMHLLAHAIWAQAALVAGAVELARGSGKAARARAGRSFRRSRSSSRESRSSCTSRTRGCTRARRSSTTRSAGCSSSSRSSRSVRRSSRGRLVWRAGFALTFVLLAVLLFADRDAAPIFGRFGLSGP